MDRILIIADPMGKGVATPRGLKLAQKLNLGVHVVSFVYEPLDTFRIPKAEQAEVRTRLMREREQVVQARIDKFSTPGQSVSQEVFWEKDIVGWIKDTCAKGDFQAVIKTGRRTESLVHSSTDWQLLRECSVPVLIVAEKKWHRTKPVLVALDMGSSLDTKRALNHKVLAAGKFLAQALEVELRIITAIEIPTFLSDLDLVDPIAFSKEAREEMLPHLQELAAAHDIPEESFQFKRGPVEKVITSRAAKVRAQMVVMGTVGRTGVKARLLGNTAERVLHLLRTDVLAIKP